MVLEIFTSGAVIFFSAGLMVYWCSRTLLALRESEEEFDEVLDADLWWGRRMLYVLRTLLFPPAGFTAA